MTSPAPCSSTSPTIEQAGAQRIGDFMAKNLETGFGSLEEVADAIAEYNPHRPSQGPRGPAQERAPACRRPLGVALGSRFMSGPRGSRDEARLVITPERPPPRPGVSVPTLLVGQGERSPERGGRTGAPRSCRTPATSTWGAGHMVAGDRNDLFNDAIVGFLDSLVPAPRREAARFWVNVRATRRSAWGIDVHTNDSSRRAVGRSAAGGGRRRAVRDTSTRRAQQARPPRAGTWGSAVRRPAPGRCATRRRAGSRSRAISPRCACAPGRRAPTTAARRTAASPPTP